MTRPQRSQHGQHSPATLRNALVENKGVANGVSVPSLGAHSLGGVVVTTLPAQKQLVDLKSREMRRGLLHSRGQCAVFLETAPRPLPTIPCSAMSASQSTTYEHRNQVVLNGSERAMCEGHAPGSGVPVSRWKQKAGALLISSREVVSQVAGLVDTTSSVL